MRNKAFKTSGAKIKEMFKNRITLVEGGEPSYALRPVRVGRNVHAKLLMHVGQKFTTLWEP